MAAGRCRRIVHAMTTYDYIVVGAGSAGCAVAGRLATESSASVLLIEAGGSDRRLRIRAPLMAAMQYGTSLDWAYETEPEPGCADRRITQPRGRVLGGCSAMNAMYWIKGSNLDYDAWRCPAGAGMRLRRCSLGLSRGRCTSPARHTPTTCPIA